ncbi:MAG TPA: AMP-binding protein, partial [Candidatus Binatia bacterium]|nr:AMP-binding protein [Candidatus Binatia bacterium]
VRTRADEPCLWQYSSGTTGRAKGTIHTHHNVRELMGLYPREILEISANDITFSAAKLFFDTRSCAELPNSQDRVRAGP